ncbi:MAG: phage holin family protein [Candidatus Wildermuthbacteria bacterium]|nr:phage holin family protein [Candidatus Wildermuthbacteria bacterium]
MFQSLVLNVLASIGGLWLALLIVPGVEFKGPWYFLLIAGAILGILYTFIRPLLELLTLPLRILTLGLSGILVNMLILWLLDILFDVFFSPATLDILGIIALFWTTLIIWLAMTFIGLLKKFAHL